MSSIDREYKSSARRETTGKPHKTKSSIQQMLIKILHYQTKKSWCAAKETLEHQFHIVLVGAVAAFDIYFILPYQHKLPRMIALLVQLIIFRFCFVSICNELEACIRRGACLITNVVTDHNVVQVSQICFRRTATDRQNPPDDGALSN